MINASIADHYLTGDYIYAAELAASGWHLAERLRDHAPILVNAAGDQAYVFRESLLGTAVQRYEDQ